MTVKEREQENFKAAQAFEVWSALMKAQRDNPRLMHNAYFDELIAEAHFNFQTAFARLA